MIHDWSPVPPNCACVNCQLADAINLLTRADSICSLAAARGLTDEDRTELRTVALDCREMLARYREARQ